MTNDDKLRKHIRKWLAVQPSIANSPFLSDYLSAIIREINIQMDFKNSHKNFSLSYFCKNEAWVTIIKITIYLFELASCLAR